MKYFNNIYLAFFYANLKVSRDNYLTSHFIKNASLLNVPYVWLNHHALH